MIVKDKAGNTQEMSFDEKTIAYLVDKVAVGDYVAYDAGTWTTSSNGTTSGTNKGTSVNSNGSSYKAPTNGWRVLSKSGSGSSGIVTLIHAGTPETYASPCYVATTSVYWQLSSHQSGLSSRASEYLNSTWATSARSVSSSDVNSLDTSNGGLRNINSYYWVSDYGYQWTSSSGSTTWYYPTVYYFSNNGSYSSNYGGTYGVRPVVVLKSGIGTNDSKDTDFLGQTCWALIN